MNIARSFMRGSVARRIFALFVLSAFLPMMVMAVLTFSQVRGILSDQARTRLIANSKDFALSVNQRLLLVQGNLSRIALSIRNGGSAPSGPLLNTLKVFYTSLTIVGPGSRSTPIIGKTIAWPKIGEPERAHLAEGKSELLVRPSAVGSQKILLLHMIDPGKHDFALIAELNQAKLWGTEEDFPYMTGLCMFAKSGSMLFCSQPELRAESATLERSVADPSPDSRVQIDGESRIMGQWELFLKPIFDEPYWTAVAVQPMAIAMLPVDQFSRIFIGVIALALLLVALLSVSQIRRTMGPLEKLIKGTQRVANEDFEHRVDVTGQDEFGTLAASFNDMAKRLGSQLGTLKVLSNIDQAILSKQDIDPVIGIVLARIRKIASADFAGIVVLERSAAGEARIYFQQTRHGSDMEMRRIRVNAERLMEFAGQDKGFWLDDSENLQHFFPQDGFRITGKLFVLPILAEGALSAFICLEFKYAGELQPNMLTHLQDLGGRIGVAMSAVARDEKLIYQARHDDLTGLPNRLFFKERLSSEISFAQREGRIMALLFVDLDRFKSINDTLGHSAGDDLLKEAAQRLRHCGRDSDTVARLGGDEFAIILPAIPGIRSATTVAEHILQTFSQSFAVAGQENHISASIGIAIYPADGNDGEDLLRKADTAMYRAKELGRDRFVYFEERMNIEVTEHKSLEREMRQGLLHKEFVLYYQPKLDLQTGQIAGAEALLRWNHPARGLVSPDTFIGVAEDTGLIDEIGRNVIWDACVQHAAWRAAGISVPRIAVNVSGRQFRRGDLVQEIGDALQTTSTPPDALEIEVTESLFINDTSDATNALMKLRQMGLKVTIDDFGTGYSSMSYLRRLPMDCLKIDQSFVGDMVTDENARAIAEVIITLAHTLRKSVVAEGVETVDQLNLLREWQCDAIQGYYFSKPLTPEQFVLFLQERSTEGTLS